MAAGLSCCSNHFREPDARTLLDVAGAGAEGEAIEKLLGAFAVGKRDERGWFWLAVGLGFELMRRLGVSGWLTLERGEKLCSESASGTSAGLDRKGAGKLCLSVTEPAIARA